MRPRHRHAAALYRHAYALLGDRGEAEAVAREVLGRSRSRADLIRYVHEACRERATDPPPALPAGRVDGAAWERSLRRQREAFAALATVPPPPALAPWWVRKVRARAASHSVDVPSS